MNPVLMGVKKYYAQMDIQRIIIKTRSALKQIFIILAAHIQTHTVVAILVGHMVHLLRDGALVQTCAFVAIPEKMAPMLSRIPGAGQVKVRSRVISTKSMLHAHLKLLTTQYVIHVGVFHDAKV